MSEPIILQHGINWVIQPEPVACPECEANRDYISHIVHENKGMYTAECECTRCGCKWTWSRRGEEILTTEEQTGGTS